MATRIVNISTIKVTKDESERVQKWLEDIHYPEMHASKCFVDDATKVLDTANQPDHETMDTIVYTHEFVGNVAVGIYDNRFRPTLVARFKEELGNLLTSGALVVKQTRGIEQRLEFPYR